MGGGGVGLCLDVSVPMNSTLEMLFSRPNTTKAQTLSHLCHFHCKLKFSKIQSAENMIQSYDPDYQSLSPDI